MAIFFLSIYLVSTTELCELLKMPILIEHFLEYKQQDPEYSLVSFLLVHYSNHLEDHPHDEDYEQDIKLPFMVHSDVLSFCFVNTPAPYFELKARSFVQQTAKKMLQDDSFREHNFSSFIWQPPKFC